MKSYNHFHYDEMTGYESITSVFSKLLKSYGYRQVLTPTFEYYDMYDFDGALPRQKMIKLIDNVGRVLVLKPDATVPITRLAAASDKNRDAILKLGYITNIFRNYSSDNSKNEFIQAGVEYLGNRDSDCDAEIIALSVNTLLELGFKDIHIDIGNVSFLNSLFYEVDIDQTTRNKILNLIENKNMGELEQQLLNIRMPSMVKEVLIQIPMLFGSFDKTISKSKKYCLNQNMKEAVDFIEETYDILRSYSYDNYVYLDLGFTNQFNYYSGLIFKGYVNGIGEAVLAGGRYDNLSSCFGVDRPASGFGINLTSLMKVLKSNSLKEKVFDLLLIYEQRDIKQAVKYAHQLRCRGISVNCVKSTFKDNTVKADYKVTAYLLNGNLYYKQKAIDFSKLIALVEEDN